MTIRLTELEIKARILSELQRRAEISKKSIIATEFRLGNSSNRADLAILSDKFIGVEIKSELDSLRRLASQTKGYLAYFDRVIVVLATRHINKIDRLVLAHVEVWEINKSGKFSVFSKPLTSAKTERKSLLDLMTKQECKRFCTDYKKLPLGCEALSERQSFELAFRHRFELTSMSFWRDIGRRAIRASDLQRLSRFRDRRQEFIRWSKMQAAQWKQWQLKAELHFARSTQT